MFLRGIFIHGAKGGLSDSRGVGTGVFRLKSSHMFLTVLLYTWL